MKIPRVNAFSIGVQEADKNQTTTPATRKKNTRNVPIPINEKIRVDGVTVTLYTDVNVINKTQEVTFF